MVCAVVLPSCTVPLLLSFVPSSTSTRYARHFPLSSFLHPAIALFPTRNEGSLDFSGPEAHLSAIFRSARGGPCSWRRRKPARLQCKSPTRSGCLAPGAQSPHRTPLPAVPCGLQCRETARAPIGVRRHSTMPGYKTKTPRAKGVWAPVGRWATCLSRVEGGRTHCMP